MHTCWLCANWVISGLNIWFKSIHLFQRLYYWFLIIIISLNKDLFKLWLKNENKKQAALYLDYWGNKLWTETFVFVQIQCKPRTFVKNLNWTVSKSCCYSSTSCTAQLFGNTSNKCFYPSRHIHFSTYLSLLKWFSKTNVKKSTHLFCCCNTTAEKWAKLIDEIVPNFPAFVYYHSFFVGSYKLFNSKFTSLSDPFWLV